MTFAQSNDESRIRLEVIFLWAIDLCQLQMCLRATRTHTQSHTVSVYSVYIQYLKGGDLVFEHFLGFVEVRQHILRLSAVNCAQLGQLPLVLLQQLLFVSPEETEEWTVEEFVGGKKRLIVYY